MKNIKTHEQAEALRVALIDLRSLVSMVEWLEMAPFEDGQPFYETANPVIEEVTERIHENLLLLDEDMANVVLSIRDGEAPGWAELGEVELWNGLSEQVVAKFGMWDGHDNQFYAPNDGNSFPPPKAA